MNRGFSLIEVALACFVVLMGFVAVAQINPMGSRGTVMSKERLTAQRIARNVIDEVRSRPFGADPSALKGPVAMDGESVEGKAIGEEYSVSNVSLDIPSGGTTPVGFGTVSVTVTWRQSVGTTHGNGDNSLTMTGGLSREP
jgi:Tfp pilus assembly protein PilV